MQTEVAIVMSILFLQSVIGEKLVTGKRDRKATSYDGDEAMIENGALYVKICQNYIKIKSIWIKKLT